MSKQYFTKFFPVEGEIKEGDEVKNNLDGIQGKALGIPSKAEIESKEYSKLKLFLCSIDVQPEDYGNTNLQIHIYFDGSFPPFKVIGEISPGAIFVSEKD